MTPPGMDFALTHWQLAGGLARQEVDLKSLQMIHRLVLFLQWAGIQFPSGVLQYTIEGIRNRYWISTNYSPLTDLLIPWESIELKSAGSAVPNILLVKIFNLLKTDRFSCYEKGQWLMMVVSFNAISAECEIASSSFPYCNSAKTFTPLLHSIIHFS